MNEGGFSLNALDTRAGADEGVEIEIIAPDGSGTGFVLRLLGEDSKTYKAVMEAQRKRLFKTAMRGTAQAAPKVDDQLARVDENTLELLVACTLGWKMRDGSTVVFNGQPFPFNEENAKRLYTDGPPIVREQAERAVKDRQNFMTRSVLS